MQEIGALDPTECNGTGRIGTGGRLRGWNRENEQKGSNDCYHTPEHKKQCAL